MLHPSTQKLIDRLAEMTQAGRLSWGAGDDGSVVYATEGYSVSVTADPHELVIFSSEGAELERATREDLVNTPYDEATYSDVLETLHRQASRIAKGTEKAITSLLAGIDTAAPVAPTASEPTDLVEDSINETDPEAVSPGEVSSDQADATQQDEPDEPDMATAVARMADEVNAQQADITETRDGALTAAAAGLAATVGQSDLAETKTVEDPSHQTAPEPATDEDKFDYVPFGAGLDLPDPAISAAIPELPEQDGPEISEDTITEVAPVAAITETVSPVELPEEDALAEQNDPLPSDVAETTETVTLIASAADTENADDEQAGPVEALDANSDPGHAPADDSQDVITTGPISLEPETGTETAAIFDQESETTGAPETKTETETEDTGNVVAFTSTFASPSFSETPAAPNEVLETAEPDQTAEQDPVSQSEIAADTPPPMTPNDDADSASTPTTYSLSGIGAGFGLGALKATTEATGGPAPTEFQESVTIPEEKIVIDATDDLPPPETAEPAFPTRTADPLPDLASLEVPEPPEAADKPEDTATTPESTDGTLKPRTRFNPWT